MDAPADFTHLDCVQMQKKKSITFVISDADFASVMPQLKPRYHLNVLIYLISNGVFLGSARGCHSGKGPTSREPDFHKRKKQNKEEFC